MVMSTWVRGPSTTYAGLNVGYSYLATHPEALKPAIPYQPGAVFSARSHIPPKPPRGSQFYPTEASREEIKSTHPLELCFKHPPEGQHGDVRLRLKVTQEIRVKDPGNAQLVLVEPTVVTPGGSPSFTTTSLMDWTSSGGQVVAKFFDPLYYDFDEYKFDPFVSSDATYRHEVEAYHRMQPLHGKVVPRFFGSYAVDIPLPNDYHIPTRPVQAVLYEYIPGILLASQEAMELSQSQRKAIMAAVINVYDKLWQLDVNFSDLHPRNMIVVSAEVGHKADVRYIDFGDASVGFRARQGEAHTPTLEPRPFEEVYQWWQDENLDAIVDFKYLIDWPWNDWLKNEYQKTM